MSTMSERLRCPQAWNNLILKVNWNLFATKHRDFPFFCVFQTSKFLQILGLIWCDNRGKLLELLEPILLARGQRRSIYRLFRTFQRNGCCLPRTESLKPGGVCLVVFHFLGKDGWRVFFSLLKVGRPTGSQKPLKSNMDTQNDGLEKVTPFKTWLFWVSMLDFWGVNFYSSAKKKDIHIFLDLFFSFATFSVVFCCQEVRLDPRMHLGLNFWSS